MPDERGSEVKQKAAAGHNAIVAGRDQMIVNTIGAAGAAKSEMPGLLPRDAPAFTGREGELKRLTALAEGGSVIVTAIDGTAGVGKTALALHAAHQLLPEFPDGHLYADLRGYSEGLAPAEPGEVLEMFLRCLGVDIDKVPASMEEQSGLLRQMLASRRVLMVLDNAAAEGQVRPLLPGAGGSLVLITSRSALPGLEINERIGLDVLPEETADKLVARLIGPERAGAEPEALRQVRDLCGRLPLALRIAGQILVAHPAWPIARLARMLADEDDRLRHLSAGDLQVRAAFAVSYQDLADDDARMFRLLGLHPGPDFDTTAAASLAGISLKGADEVLERLVEAHLVTEDSSERYHMHDLLRLFARSTCHEIDEEESRNAAEGRLVRHYTELAEYTDFCVAPATPAAKQAGKSLLTPRQALLRFEAERLDLMAALRLAEQRGWNDQVWQLGKNVGGVLMLLRYIDDMLTVEEAVLAAARRLGDAAAEGLALNDLGAAYSHLRREDEAITCYNESMAIRRRIGDRRGEGQALINLGGTYEDLEQFDEAITAVQGALAIFGELGHKDGEALALVHLGYIYQQLERSDEAITLLQESLTISQGIGDRTGESRALSCLGDTYWSVERFDEAIACFQQDVVLCGEIGDRHSEGTALNDLGRTLAEVGRLEEAIAAFEDATAILQGTKDRHSGGIALNNLGKTLQRAGRLEEVITAYQNAAAIYQETGDRLGEGYALWNLGDAYHDLQQADRAAACWRDAATAMRDAGDHEGATQLEQETANAQPRRRRRKRTH